MSNPYDPHSQHYNKSGNPYGNQNHLQSDSPFTSPDAARDPFVDPYQPVDRQPKYAPAVTIAELQEVNGKAREKSPKVSIGGKNRAKVRPDDSRSVAAAVSCLAIVTVFQLGHVILLGLLVAGIYYAACKSQFAKAWAAASFNSVLTYCIWVIVRYIPLGILEFMGLPAEGKLLFATLPHFVFLFALLVATLSSLCGRFFRIPLAIPVLKA